MAQPTGTIVFPKRFMPKERWDLAAIDAAQKAIVKHLAIFEQQLAQNDYLVGKHYSLADIAYIPFPQFLPLTELTPPPAVQACPETLLSRPDRTSKSVAYGKRVYVRFDLLGRLILKAIRNRI